MPALEFSCVGAEPDRYAATPTLRLRLRVAETTGTTVHALALRCQLRIEPHRRHYTDREAEALLDLFGERSRWQTTRKPLQLAFVTQVVTGFTGVTEVDLPVPCSYDFDVAAHKYLYAVETGEIPLLLLFTGSIFTVDSGRMAVVPVPWDQETSFRLPATVWHEVMELSFPGTAWMRVRRDTFDALHRYRARHGLLSWDDAVERLMKEADQ